ncbi:MAG TPA: hypothetical protein VJP78_04015 [Thermoleophilia bacterium]|nr:hypothetical protein [Thermoleophilia bacterium]
MKTTLLIVIVAVLTLGWLLSRTRSKDQRWSSQAVPEPVQAIKDLRNQLLTSPPETLGFSKAGSDSEVWGILMETGYPEALATLVSLRDGNASLYLGHGGGVIGGGGHENVRRAAIGLVKESAKYLTNMKSTTSFPYPAVGRVKFYVLTFNGVVTAEAGKNELGEGKHGLSPLFYAGHEVITQLRQISEAPKRE